MTAMTELVGRGRELESLATHVASGRPVLVSGEAGIGKTSLMRAAAAHSGLPVFWGRCLATLWWVSHQPLRQAISLSETEAAGDPLAVSDLVRRRVGDGVLVLDDVQWADPGTWALLPLLAGEIRMMTAVRSGQPGFRAHAERLIAASFERCVVGPLDTGAIVAVVRQVCPDLDPTRVGNVAAAAGGNPLLAEEFARAGGPSARLDALVSTRVIDLPARERLALARLALLGLGPDGHTASLFPGSRAIRESERLVLAVRPPDAPTSRITVTPRLLNAAREVVILTAGALKAGALLRVLARDGAPESIPARLVDPASGRFEIVTDLEACERLDEEPLRDGIVTIRL